MVFFIKNINYILKNKIFLSLLLLAYLIKIAVNNFLLAENGDTYDFFKVAHFIRNMDISYESKRMPLLPLILSIFPPEYFVQWGRIVINLFYFGSIIIFYKYFILLKSKNIEKKKQELAKLKISSVSVFVSLIFATNIIIFENSFYILADTIFLFWNLLFLYIYRKYNTNKIFWLSLVAGLAFYTRPEGLILYIALSLIEVYRITKSHKDRKMNIRNYEIRNFVILVFSGLILILPFFLRNFFLYEKILYSGYLEDQAGFIFTKELFLQRIGNFLFGLGGIWLLPTIYLLFKSEISKPAKNYRTAIEKNINVEVIIFVLYSTTLILWGPYVRLYSIPLTFLLIFVFKKLIEWDEVKINNKDLAILIILYLLSAISYVVIVQKYNHEDLGYRKLGKAISIFSSLFLPAYLIAYTQKMLSQKNLIILFATTLIIINLFIFADKFRITRYKYYTLRLATELYLENYKNTGNLGYNSGSDLEMWYTRDFNKQNDFLRGDPPLSIWATDRNIKYIIVTKEFGHNDKFTDYGDLDNTGHRIIKEFESPFFYGKTKLIELY